MKKTFTTLFIICIAIVQILGYNNQASYTPFKLSPQVTPNDYQKNVVNFKVKEQFRTLCTNEAIMDSKLQQVLSNLTVIKLGKIFPNHKAPSKELMGYNKTPLTDLSLLFRVQYLLDMPIELVCNNLLATGIFEYAEPNYIYQTSAFNPNDPKAASGQNQFGFLTRIQAFNAWDLSLGGSQGDTSVVIAIVDSGTDTDHPDLEANFKKNYADPVNGLDDDADGYIDNFNGWDLGGADFNNIVGDNDANCMGANNDHGSHVSGCASEVTNNGIGGAGIGFNCKIMGVKCAADNDTRGPGGVGYILTGYEGISYAADHGCQIINCSWGGTGGGSFGQDIINYATNNKNALVIAAAGNSNNGLDHFPSNYIGALSVAATNNNNDLKASFSNFNYAVAVSAPGNGIYSTLYNDSYATYSGTSMASPIVAGICGLVKSKFPTLTALQIKERVRITCDPNYTGTNSGFKGRLGKGRANAFKALTSPSMPSIRLIDYFLSDGNDGSISNGDTISMMATFKNYLNTSTSALKATLYAGGTAASNGYITILPADSQKTIGVINTFDSSTTITAFKFVIKPTAPQNAGIVLRFAFRDLGYVDDQYLPLTVNADYINVYMNEINTSVTSKARLFYNTDAQADGLGFVYKGNALAYEGGFMVGTPGVVMDNCRSTAATPDDDWQNILTVKRNSTNPTSDVQITNKFNDVLAPSTLGFAGRLNFNAYNTPGNTKFVIHEYTIKNTTATTKNNVYAGMFIDWDIQNYSNNKGATDATLNLGYCYNTDSLGLYAGVKLLSNGSFISHAADNLTAATPINFSDGVTDAEKYSALSTNNLTAGGIGTGNDIINVVGTGPFTIAAGDSLTIAYAILAGDNLADLQTSANNAQIKYAILTSINNLSKLEIFNGEISLYPNPTKEKTTLLVDSKETATAVIEIYNAQGVLIKKLDEINTAKGPNKIEINLTELYVGNYFLKVQIGSSFGIKKFTIMK